MENNEWAPSILGYEFIEKREIEEMKVMWRQLKSLCFAVVLYAGVSVIWGQKIMFVFGAMALGIIIYHFNKI